MPPRSAHIFIVDDDPDVVETIRETLSTIKEASFLVTVCDNGHTAYVKAKEFLPDLILMDVMMPRWDGFQAYERLKDYDPTAKIPVLFLTAANRREDLERAVKLKIQHYIAKPFDTAVLVKKIKEILNL